MILTALYKKDHWLVSGPTFYQLNLLFDKHAGEELELSTCSRSASRASGASRWGILATLPS